MEKLTTSLTIHDPIHLPPGFRIHPTDEELITRYLSHKVINPNFTSRAIGEVDLDKVEPWDLSWKAKTGEREWYFFCMRDRKYPTGIRTNRAALLEGNRKRYDYFSGEIFGRNEEDFGVL